MSFDVHFDFTQAGRVRVHERQICFDTFTPTASKALCSSKGFIYASHQSALVYFTYQYVDMVCSARNLTSCSLHPPKHLCRKVVYIHCSSKTHHHHHHHQMSSSVAVTNNLFSPHHTHAVDQYTCTGYDDPHKARYCCLSCFKFYACPF